MRNLLFIGGFLGIVTLAAGMFSGCSEESTELNALVGSLPLSGVLVKDTTLVPLGSTFYRQNIPINAGVNMVGHSGNYTAYSAISFYPSTFPTRDTALVYSAKLHLRLLTWVGDSTGRLSFTVHEILRGWGESGVTWDTMQTAFYNQSVVRGSYSAGASPDTQIVSISLDTAMVRPWFHTQGSTDTRYGIILIPAPDCNIIRGFNAFGYDSTQFQPQLEIIAGNTSGANLDTAMYTLGMDTFAGTQDNFTPLPDHIYVQSTVEYRSRLVFDVSSIPRGAIINSATLQFTRDPAASHFSRFTTDTTFELRAATSPTDTNSLDGLSSKGNRAPGTQNTFTIDARRPVQLWNHGMNYGLVVSPGTTSGFTTFDLLSFYNEKASDPSVRPRLKVVYSVAQRQGGGS